MNLMKFANNHSEDFVRLGSEIGFMLGGIQVLTALIAEVINLWLLSLQHTISPCIMHFVALEVIMEVSNYYFEALMNNKLKVIMHHPPKLHIKGLRCLYVSVVFYYVPFFVIFL